MMNRTMHRESFCYVTAPKVSIFTPNLYRTPGYVMPRPLSEELYCDTEIHYKETGLIPHYQIGQYLYEEAVTVKQFPNDPSSIEGDFGLKGTIVPESSELLSLIYAHPQLRSLKEAIVCQPTAKTYNADGSDFLIIPMASQLCIRTHTKIPNIAKSL